MKYLLLATLMLNVSAKSSLKELCYNAYYATNYVELGQYSVAISWEKVSDYNLVKLENIIYGDLFTVLSEKDINGKTYITIKENYGADYSSVEAALEELSNYVSSLNCKYNI